MKRPISFVAALLLLVGCAQGSPSDPPPMVDIAGGSFVMGAPEDDNPQQGKPQHQVSVAPFRLGLTEVTFAQYDQFAGDTNRPLPQDDGLGRADRPVINIDRADMLAYIAWLNDTSNAGGFRLPSEAEWEYAAHAGTTTRFYWGDEPNSDLANVRGMTGVDQWELTAPVGRFAANPWGLYDMAGNVWEMVADCRFANYAGAPVNGSARMADDCQSFIARGGDYSVSQRGQRPTARIAAGRHFRSTSLGFRLAQDIK